MSIQTSKLKCKENKLMKQMKQIFKNCGTITKVQPNCSGNTRSGREIKQQKKYLKNIFKIMAENVPKLMKDIRFR